MRNASASGLWLALAFALGCTDGRPVRDVQPWPELTALFQDDARWVGGDGAYSCDLGGNRVLWLFGDSLIAKDAARNRDTAWFIRNSAAVQTGYDPAAAFMAFYWGEKGGRPSSFIAEQDDRWFWPGACMRVGKGVVIFGQWLRQQSAGQFGFGTVGSAALFVADAGADPLTWQPQDAHLAAVAGDVILGTAGLAVDDFLYVYGNKGTAHDYVLARFAVADAQRGDLAHAAFFSNGTWRAVDTLGGSPEAIFADGAPESSVHFEPHAQAFVMVQSQGFGATTLALRTAPAPEGPWSEAVSFCRPPESFEEGAFVYAGKAHPEIAGGGLAVSYVPSRFDDDPRPTPPEYYFPHFLRVTF